MRGNAMQSCVRSNFPSSLLGRVLLGCVIVLLGAAAATAQTAADHVKKGDELYGNGDLNGALTEYRLAANADAQYPAPHVGIGNVLDDQGDHNGAIREYREALRIDPNNLGAHFNLGVTL